MFPEELIPRAKSVMRQLEAQLGQTIGLGCLVSGEPTGIVLATVDGTAGFAFHIEVGFRFPLHTSAPGKAMLAYLPPDERSAYYSCMDFQKYTPGTITSRQEFSMELESVVEKGYAIDVSEQIEGCHCVGVPVFDAERKVVAALWTTGPSSQLPVRRFPEIADIMKKGAQELGLRLRTTGRNPSRAYVLSVIEQAEEMIGTNLHSALDMKELAENLYVSYSWFRKVFKEKTGEAPAEYHLNLRLEKACELLRDTNQSVRQIAEDIGFKNQNHFSAFFKRKTGHSPSAYRVLDQPL
jgi:DNA-binding IclR family transcriptional regulator